MSSTKKPDAISSLARLTLGKNDSLVNQKTPLGKSNVSNVAATPCALPSIETTYFSEDSGDEVVVKKGLVPVATISTKDDKDSAKSAEPGTLPRNKIMTLSKSLKGMAMSHIGSGRGKSAFPKSYRLKWWETPVDVKTDASGHIGITKYINDVQTSVVFSQFGPLYDTAKLHSAKLRVTVVNGGIISDCYCARDVDQIGTSSVAAGDIQASVLSYPSSGEYPLLVRNLQYGAGPENCAFEIPFPPPKGNMHLGVPGFSTVPEVYVGQWFNCNSGTAVKITGAWKASVENVGVLTASLLYLRINVEWDMEFASNV